MVIYIETLKPRKNPGFYSLHAIASFCCVLSFLNHFVSNKSESISLDPDQTRHLKMSSLIWVQIVCKETTKKTKKNPVIKTALAGKEVKVCFSTVISID